MIAEKPIEQILEENREPETFLYEDFFTDPNDRGVEVEIPHRGRLLKFRIKRSLTLAERQSAADAAVKIEFDKDGTPRLSKMDQGEYTKRIVLSALKWWPFEYSRGKPVPINEREVGRMDSVLADAIASIVLGQTNAQKAALDPFAMKSDEG